MVVRATEVTHLFQVVGIQLSGIFEVGMREHVLNRRQELWMKSVSARYSIEKFSRAPELYATATGYSGESP